MGWCGANCDTAKKEEVENPVSKSNVASETILVSRVNLIVSQFKGAHDGGQGNRGSFVCDEKVVTNGQLSEVSRLILEIIEYMGGTLDEGRVDQLGTKFCRGRWMNFPG